VNAGADLERRFRPARQVADAVLYEGYVLYPYRASARKNQLRWQFGVLAPPNGGADPSTMQTEVVVRGTDDTRVHVRIRALQVVARTVEEMADGAYRRVERLDAGESVWTSFDEAAEHDLDVVGLPLGELRRAEHRATLYWPGGVEEEPILGPAGETLGRTVRRRWPVSGVVRLRAGPTVGPGGLTPVSVVVENRTAWTPDGIVRRDEMTGHALVAVHALLAVDDGTFVSLLDPPEEGREAVAACRNQGTFPVLIADDVMLSSPIVLYDHPAVAPESAGDLFDATEIDEILALRVLTLTDDEKREARGTDRRAAAVVDRCDALGPEGFAALHGTFRSIRRVDAHAVGATPDGPVPAGPTAGDDAAEAGDGTDDGWDGLRGGGWDPAAAPWWDPAVDGAFDPWSDTVRVGADLVASGTRVRLRPSRRADAQDLFVDGREAIVAGVFHDVDGGVYLAVSVDDGPAELAPAHGRYLYFATDEVEVLETAGGSAS